MAILYQDSPFSGKIWNRLWIDYHADMKTMRKFLLWGVFPFLLLSCEMRSKQTLSTTVSMLNAMCPMSVRNTELMIDSVLYKGNEKRVRFCYSIKESENRKENEEIVRKSDEEERLWGLFELFGLFGVDQLNQLRLDMTRDNFDMQISYIDSKGGVLKNFVYGKDEYDMSQEELFSFVLEETLQDEQSRLPQDLDFSTVWDSLSCDTKNHRVVQYYTIHDFNMEGLNVDAIFAYNKKLIVDNLISNYNSLIFMAVSGYSWEFVHDYKMNGSSLSRFSITREDLDSAMLESFRN